MVNVDELVEAYNDRDPTPENNIEIIKELAEEFEESPNKIRIMLRTAGVLKENEIPAASKAAAKPKKAKAESTPRVSKEDAIAALVAAIEAKDLTVDEDIVNKLTGKAAIYFTSLLNS